jgi:predicted HAD superfamily phosphohydrolase YqeG
MVEIRPPNVPVPYEELFVPNYLADAVTDVDFQRLKEQGINTVLFDVDNTLVTVGGYKINPELLAFLRKVKEANVIKHLYLASRARGVSPRMGSVAFLVKRGHSSSSKHQSAYSQAANILALSNSNPARP